VGEIRLLFVKIVSVFLVVFCAGNAGADQGISFEGVRCAVETDGNSYRLKLDNIMLGEDAYSVDWTLDFATAAWTFSSVEAAPSPDLQFSPDPGIRVDYASIPGAVVDRETGVVYLTYTYNREGTGPGIQLVSTAADGLEFGPGVDHGTVHARFSLTSLLAPDGRWRRYNAGRVPGTLESSVSTDGFTFVREPGIRYTLPENDNGSMGVSTMYTDPTGAVVLFYVGDMGHADNVRLAYSIDGGLTFTQETDNLLGDRDLDATEKFVDPRTLLLPDGRRRLITMRRGRNGTVPVPGTRAVGELVTFISTDGKTYHREPGIRLSPGDFTEFAVWSLNDPTLVRLPDGRFRIYVAALVDDTSPDAPSASKWVIVSATSAGGLE